jgi:hypothetical protein
MEKLDDVIIPFHDSSRKKGFNTALQAVTFKYMMLGEVSNA